MKILWLGTSNHVERALPEEQRTPHLVRRQISESLDTHVDVEVRAIWPTEGLPRLVASWMEQHEPDLVLLQISNYSFAYESVPLKIQRKLGRLGKPVADAGVKAADIGWIASTPLFHAGRRFAQRTIGGVTHFEPEEVLERVSASIRIILRSEDTALLVRGPQGSNDYFASERSRIRGEARRRFVNGGLRDLCQELHVVFDGLEAPSYESVSGPRLGDRIHFEETGHRRVADEITPWLVKAWMQLHPELQDPSANIYGLPSPSC